MGWNHQLVLDFFFWKHWIKDFEFGAEIWILIALQQLKPMKRFLSFGLKRKGWSLTSSFHGRAVGFEGGQEGMHPQKSWRYFGARFGNDFYNRIPNWCVIFTCICVMYYQNQPNIGQICDTRSLWVYMIIYMGRFQKLRLKETTDLTTWSEKPSAILTARSLKKKMLKKKTERKHHAFFNPLDFSRFFFQILFSGFFFPDVFFSMLVFRAIGFHQFWESTGVIQPSCYSQLFTHFTWGRKYPPNGHRWSTPPRHLYHIYIYMYIYISIYLCIYCLFRIYIYIYNLHICSA